MTNQELRLERARLGMTQAQLAEFLQVTRRSIVYWESGQKPVPYLVGEVLRLRRLERAR